MASPQLRPGDHPRGVLQLPRDGLILLGRPGLASRDEPQGTSHVGRRPPPLRSSSPSDFGPLVDLGAFGRGAFDRGNAPTVGWQPESVVDSAEEESFLGHLRPLRLPGHGLELPQPDLVDRSGLI